LTNCRPPTILNHVVDLTGEDRLDAVFHALADRTRRAILRQVAERELSLREIAADYDMSMQAVSKHVKVLEAAGLVVKTKEGRVRRCRLEFEPLRHASELIGHYKEFWEKQFDSLEEYLRETQTRRKKR
jgi:DNA-binding transcriptional ArsR family regulator